MAEAAAATAAGGAVMYPTVVGETGGLKGQKGVLDQWAASCSRCRQENCTQSIRSAMAHSHVQVLNPVQTLLEVCIET